MQPESIDSRADTDATQPLIAALLAKIDELLAQNEALLARIAKLEARNAKPPKTPENSSLPPSRGQKANAAPPAPSPGKPPRKGRPGVARDLCPEPDQTRDIPAERCTCGAVLDASEQEIAHAYDHIDLPPIKPITTRINLRRATCPCCAKRVTATPPAGMGPGSPFGPGIVATVAYLHGAQMVSYGRMTEVLGGLFGLKVSEGAIANMLARTAEPFAAKAGEIAQRVRSSPVIASDETSARVKGKTHWQWVFATATAVAHIIAPTRGKVVPREFLGAARPKVWLSDRYLAQCRHADAHQFCLAHLLRDAQYAIDAGDAIFAPGFKAFLTEACAVGRDRPGLRDGEIKAHARRLKRHLDRLLDLEPTQAEGRKLRDAITVNARDKLLVFLTRRDVEPTNNVSERALRPSVIFRKVTNGFRSDWGAKVYADFCSIVATGRLNGLSALASIRAALPPATATA